MQERYIGDAGDFGKYGLLRFLAEQTNLRLGVIWYHTKPEAFGISEPIGDGRHRGYLKQRKFSAPFFSKLLGQMAVCSEDPQKRSFRHLQEANVFPSTTVFDYISEEDTGEMPYVGKSRTKERQDWFNKSVGKVKAAELVYLDPDNGFIVPSASGKKFAKYVKFQEAQALFNAGKSIVVYQHKPMFHRRENLYILTAKIRTQLPEMGEPIVLSYYLGTDRYYFIFSTPEHRVRICRAVELFRGTTWFDSSLGLFS